jgi:hypothetical protein
MPSTYLELTNSLLTSFNEVALTSGNFPNAIGPQANAKDAINDALSDLVNAERQWPFNIVETTQVLTPGVQTYSLPSTYKTVDWASFYIYTPDIVTNGQFAANLSGWTDYSSGTGAVAWNSGTARFTPGASGVAAIEQQLAVIRGTVYRVFVRTFLGTINVNIGSTSGGSDLYSGALTFTNIGGGQFFEVQFNPAGATAFIRFSTSEDTTVDLDYVAVFDEAPPSALLYTEYDQWRERFRQNEMRMTPTSYSCPQRVFAAQNDKFGVSTIPDKSYVVSYNYWSAPTKLNLYSDTTVIPDRYEGVLLEGAMYYMYMFRDNIEQASKAERRFKDGIREMRTDLINRNRMMTTGNYMPTRYKGSGIIF